jgi:hypothetical protein
MKQTHKVLRNHVPSGGYGRALTAAEVRDLRSVGVMVPRDARVMQNRAPHLGVMYRPQGAGYANTGVFLETSVHHVED